MIIPVASLSTTVKTLQPVSGSVAGTLGQPFSLLLICIFLSVVPFLFLAVTSFVKLSVVFSILRNAIGAGQIPSGAVVTMLSLILTFHIMSPVTNKMLERLEDGLTSLETGGKKQSAVGYLELAKSVVEPLREFLLRHAPERERLFFSSIGKEKTREEATLAKSADNSFATIVPAFVLGELKQAFAIGFVIFLPFLVVDLIVTNILAALGMMMVSPVTISLPLKLILFVLADGWFLLCRSLILGYG